MAIELHTQVLDGLLCGQGYIAHLHANQAVHVSSCKQDYFALDSGDLQFVVKRCSNPNYDWVQLFSRGSRYIVYILHEKYVNIQHLDIQQLRFQSLQPIKDPYAAARMITFSLWPSNVSQRCLRRSWQLHLILNRHSGLWFLSLNFFMMSTHLGLLRAFTTASVAKTIIRFGQKHPTASFGCRKFLHGKAEQLNIQILWILEN